jgi:uncharacterized repeat protein (TIGR04138 family)
MDMGLSVRDPVLEEISEKDDRYPYEAYEFVTETIKYLDQKLQEIEEDGPPANITARDLCVGCCELAWSWFGRLAGVVFSCWGIRSTRDIGDITFRLIEGNVIAGSDEDRIEDFTDLFDLKEFLDRPVDFTQEETEP